MYRRSEKNAAHLGWYGRIDAFIDTQGADYVEALAGAVGEAAEVAASGTVSEGERDLEWFDPGGEEVEGHADLGAEAGGDAGKDI